MTRNSFIQKIVTVWGMICSLPVIHVLIQYVIPPEQANSATVPVPAGKRSEFSPGTTKLIRQGKSAIFVRETATGQLRAFSAKCTHLGCLVELQESEQIFRCHCHGSTFDQDGRILSGPAVKSLPPYRVEVRGEDIFISLT